MVLFNISLTTERSEVVPFLRAVRARRMKESEKLASFRDFDDTKRSKRRHKESKDSWRLSGESLGWSMKTIPHHRRMRPTLIYILKLFWQEFGMRVRLVTLHRLVLWYLIWPPAKHPSLPAGGGLRPFPKGLQSDPKFVLGLPSFCKFS